MSAVLIDDLMLDPGMGEGCVTPRRMPAAAARSVASVSPLPTARSARPGVGWQLTPRGIAVVLTLFVGLFLTGVVVAVVSFLSVSDAPLVDGGVDVATVSVQR